MKFLEAVAAHRKEYGLPSGKAPKVGSEEHTAVLARMGKQTKSFKKDVEEQKAIHRKGAQEEAKHQRMIKAEQKKAEQEESKMRKAQKAADQKATKEEMKHQKMLAADAKKSFMDLARRARKGELTAAQLKAFSSIIKA